MVGTWELLQGTDEGTGKGVTRIEISLWIRGLVLILFVGSRRWGWPWVALGSPGEDWAARSWLCWGDWLGTELMAHSSPGKGGVLITVVVFLLPKNTPKRKKFF